MKTEIAPNRHFLSLMPVLAALLLVAVGAPLSIRADDHRITSQELATFDVFLDNHPDIARDLRREPRLANDRRYLTSHPDLNSFLDQNPSIRRELRENPSSFVRTENRFQRSGRDITPEEMSEFNTFLHSHPGISKDLNANPNLANDGGYLKRHEPLKKFLSRYPAIRGEFAQDAVRFMRRVNDSGHRGPQGPYGRGR